MRPRVSKPVSAIPDRYHQKFSPNDNVLVNFGRIVCQGPPAHPFPTRKSAWLPPVFLVTSFHLLRTYLSLAYTDYSAWKLLLQLLPSILHSLPRLPSRAHNYFPSMRNPEIEDPTYDGESDGNPVQRGVK